MEKNETNALLELLFKTSPHDFQAPVQVTTQMRMALAQAYAIPGFKDYLENAMNKFILSSAIQSDDMDSLNVRKGRILTLKGLLELSKTCYNDYNSLKKIASKTIKPKK